MCQVDLWNTGVLCYHLVQAKKAVLKKCVLIS
jgi:hypothetical protein